MAYAPAAVEPLSRGWRTLTFYGDALRHMRPRQLVYRPRRLLPPRAVALGLSAAHTPSFLPIAAGLGLEAAPQSGPTAPPHETRTFAAVGRERAFPPAGAGGQLKFWRDEGDGLLFLFQLHGFGALSSYAAGPRSRTGDAFWAEVLESWLTGEGRPRAPGWHPFPTSVRIVAWAAALASVSAWPERLRRRLVESLWLQARLLRRSVEHDIGGNHVVKNAKALVVAGACLSDPGLLEAGLRTLRSELAEQVLPDGGHEERSTSYHRELAHDLGELSELLERTGRAPSWLESARWRMESWQVQMAGPDRCLPLLNDAWEGPPLAYPRDRAEVREHGATGYTVLRSGEDQVVFDAGPISPPHLPPHAHADVLSFSLWADGSPLVVDPGAYSYTGPERRGFRSTSAHSTVEVAGRDQCELWGDFRAAFAPRVRSLPVVRRSDGVLIACGRHDGYRRLPDPVLHERGIVLIPGEGIVVVDLLHARSPQRVRSFLHLAPGTREHGVRRIGPFGLRALGTGGELRWTQGAYAPYLGTKVTAPVIEQERVAAPETPFGWSLLRGEGAVTTLERDRVVVTAAGRPPLEIGLLWA